MIKQCYRCKEDKEETLFKRSKDIYLNLCKECHARAHRTGKPKHKFPKGGHPGKEFHKDQIPWNKGKEMDEEFRKKMKGPIPKSLERKNFFFKQWARKVKERDGHKCQKCEATEKLHAHHIVPWKDDESKRFDIENGTTLCNSCHAKLEGFQKGHDCPPEIRKKISETKRKKHGCTRQ